MSAFRGLVYAAPAALVLWALFIAVVMWVMPS